MSNLQLRKTDNTDIVSDLSYDYYNGGNNNGRIQKITDADSSYTTTFGYDDYNRLSSASASAYTRSYSYDNWGNLTGVTSTGAGESGSYSLSYASNGSGAPSTNRISNSGYTFDSAGNVTNDGALAYTYDAASRLKTAGGDAYQYDGDGHRVRNQVNGYSNALYYLWSSVLNEPVVEIDSTTPSVFRAYVYGSGGQMLALQSYDGNFYWLHSDVLGSGRKMTDSSGAVTYRAEYDPHGQMVFESATGGSQYLYLNSHKFTGYERDWSTNLNNAKARTYNHNRARFMQPDPLGLGAADMSDPQSLNLYSYVQNDPVNFIDPSGLNLEYPGGKVCFRLHYSNPVTEEEYWGEWMCLGGSSGYSGGGGVTGGIDFSGGGQQGQNQQNKYDQKKLEDCGNQASSTMMDRDKAINAKYDAISILPTKHDVGESATGGLITGAIKFASSAGSITTGATTLGGATLASGGAALASTLVGLAGIVIYRGARKLLNSEDEKWANYVQFRKDISDCIEKYGDLSKAFRIGNSGSR